MVYLSCRAWRVFDCAASPASTPLPPPLSPVCCRQSYDRMVLAVFENRRINERVKAYKLNNLSSVGR